MLWFALLGCQTEVPVELYDPEGFCEAFLDCAEAYDEEIAFAARANYGSFGSCWRNEPKTCPQSCRVEMVELAVRSGDTSCVPEDAGLFDSELYSQALAKTWCALESACVPFQETAVCLQGVFSLRNDECFDAELGWICLAEVDRSPCGPVGPPPFPDVCQAVWACE